MPIIVKVTIQPDELLSVDQIRETFPYVDSFRLQPPENLHEFGELIITNLQNEDHLEEIDELMRDGWKDPSSWRLAAASNVVRRALGKDWGDSVVISKNPKNDEAQEMVPIIFPIKPQLKPFFELFLMQFLSDIGHFKKFVLVR